MSKNIKLIIGSTRQNRIADSFVSWVKKQSTEAGVELSIVDLKEVALPMFDAPLPPAAVPVDTPEAKAWAETIGDADGLVFLTAEYNRGLPASLKNALDYLVAEWKDKPAVVVSYGMVDGGKSASVHLTDVLNWLKVQIVEPQVHLQFGQDDLGEAGGLAAADTTLAPYAEDLKSALQKLA